MFESPKRHHLSRAPLAREHSDDKARGLSAGRSCGSPLGTSLARFLVLQAELTRTCDVGGVIRSKPGDDLADHAGRGKAKVDVPT